jgi:dimethylglycine dehydrogenase
VDGSVQIVSRTRELAGLAIAGPRSRELLSRITRAQVDGASFRFMDIRRLPLGFAEALVGRVSYTGDLGYEIWCSADTQRHLFTALQDAGKDLGLRLFGSRALNALRLEKSYGSWAREYRPLYGPLEAGFERFVALDKAADFIGKAGAIAERETGGVRRLRTFIVETERTDVIGDEPIWQGDRVVGWVTSGGYAHASGVSVAMGYVERELADLDTGWRIEILGNLCPARLQKSPLFDADGRRQRS